MNGYNVKMLQISLQNTTDRKDLITKALAEYERLGGLYEAEVEHRILNGATIDELRAVSGELVKALWLARTAIRDHPIESIFLAGSNKTLSEYLDYAIAQGHQMSKDTTHFSLNLSREMVSALAIHLFHRERPAFGWMESPLADIEKALNPVHNKIHDENFNVMDTAFFGYDRKLP